MFLKFKIAKSVLEMFLNIFRKFLENTQKEADDLSLMVSKKKDFDLLDVSKKKVSCRKHRVGQNLHFTNVRSFQTIKR